MRAMRVTASASFFGILYPKIAILCF
jgi:hypothetical protein